MNTRPYILIIQADQLATAAVGSDGSQIADTPISIPTAATAQSEMSPCSLRADKFYANRAYSNIVGYQVAEE